MTANAITLGRQRFDGLGRQRSVDVAGRVTHYHYRPGLLPPDANTLADGQGVRFAYEPQLGNALLSTIYEGGSHEQLSYHPQLAQPIEASGVQGTLQWHFSPSGTPHLTRWAIDDSDHDTHWQLSFGGLPLGFTDATGTEHQRLYDEYGRLRQVTVGQVNTRLAYDALSRLDKVTILDHASGRTLVKQLAYDAMGRECTCTFTLTGNGDTQVFTQTLLYSALDQVIGRLWSDGQEEGEARFAYDARGRLVHCTATANTASRDPFGNAIVEQHFVFNGLDGYRQVTSRFSDGSEDVATFHYAVNDPCQVVAISHSHPSWPARLELAYDAHGRVVADSLGRTLRWDAQGRLQRVDCAGRACEYRYTPAGELCDRIVDGVLHRRFFSGSQPTHETQGDTTLERVGDGASLFAVNTLTQGVRHTQLLGCDSQGSVRLESDGQVRVHHYSAHGAQPDNDQQQPFGFAGERREPLTGWYMAAGYRPYDPVLMCFLAPDSESPFGRGGLNPYAYCGGDPVNRVDPDGHSWQTWVTAGIGLALGALATVASLGAAGAAILAGGALSASGALALTTATLNAVSFGTGVAAMALETDNHHEKAASILGWISLGTGVASLATGALGHKLADKGGRLLIRANALRDARSRATPPLFETDRYQALRLHSKTGQVDMSWHDNLWGNGTRGLLTHGGKDGTLMNALGHYESPVSLALRELAPRLANVPKDAPIVLLACYGGRSGAAQKIANVLRRPVYGYDHTIYVHHPNKLQKLELGYHYSTVPQQRISTWRRLWGAKGPFDFARDSREVASGRMYFPQ